MNTTKPTNSKQLTAMNAGAFLFGSEISLNGGASVNNGQFSQVLK